MGFRMKTTPLWHPMAPTTTMQLAFTNVGTHLNKVWLCLLPAQCQEMAQEKKKHSQSGKQLLVYKLSLV